MKNVMNAALALTTLITLTACGGQTQLNPSATYAPQYGQTPYQQSGYGYQNPQQNLQQYPQGLTQQNAQSYSQAPQQQRTVATAQRATATTAQRTTASRTAATTATRTAATTAQRTTASRTATTATRTAAAKTTATRAATTKTTATPRAAAAPKLSAAQSLILKARQRFQGIKTIKTTVTCFETNAAKGPTNLKANMTFSNGRTKLEVISHQNSLFVGAKLAYQTGQDKVTARAAGALGLVPISATMDDQRIKTRRGYRLDQIDAFGIVNRLLNGNSEPKVLGKTTVNGRSIAILEFKNSNNFDSSITRELIGIDMQDHFLRIHEMYAGSELVFSLKLENLELNGPVAAKDLEV